MKKLLFITFGFIVCLNLAAQDDDEIQTLFGKGTKITGFGGPFMNFTVINGEFGHLMGGGGGVIMNGFFFGGYGVGLTNYIENIAGREIEFGHGGFWTGYSFFGSKPIHPSISTQIGFGGISVKDEGSYYSYNEEPVFVLNPTIEVEMNFTKFFRLSLGANYQWVPGVDKNNLTTQDMSGPGVFLGFKFGWF